MESPDASPGLRVCRAQADHAIGAPRMQESHQANTSIIRLPPNSRLGFPTPLEATSGITVIEIGDHHTTISIVAESDAPLRKTERWFQTACNHLKKTIPQNTQSRSLRKRIVSTCIRLVRYVLSRMFCLLLHARDVRRNHQAYDRTSTERRG